MKDYNEPNTYVLKDEIDYKLVTVSILALYSVSWACVRAWGLL